MGNYHVTAIKGCETWVRCAGESIDLSFLDPINRADTPPRAIQLAAGELRWRIGEGKRRLTSGLGDAADSISRRRMHGKPGERK